MAATNYTPIQLYRTNTASTTAPSGANLNFGELAINYNDGGMILYAKNTSGSVIKLMNNPANLLYPTADGSNGQSIITNGSGTLSFGTIGVPGGGTGASSLTLNNVILGNGTSAVQFVAPGANGNVLTSNGTTWTSAAPATSGTVTSVSWTGGIVSIANPTTTPAFTIAGTSGGIPYFSSSSAWASSGVLTANAIMVGGGAGVAPSTVTTGTNVLTALGVNVGSAGAFVVNGGALGTPSTGTLTNATGLPISTGVSGLGTGVATALANTANATGGLTTINGTATLTNKRIDPRVSSTASASSVTPDIASYDQYAFTALAAGLTINAPTGTPVDGNKLIFRLLDNGTSRALSWDATYTAIGVTLPTATTVSKTTYVGCIYNANNTRWDVVAVTTQA